MTVPTRDRLLDAAREVVAEDGLEGLTLRAIARRADVSHGAPLRHFPGLASLLAAVAAAGFGRLVATIDTALSALPAGAGPSTRLAASGRAYVAFALAEPGVFSVMFRPEMIDLDDRAYQDEAARSFTQLVDLVTAAQAAGWHPDEDAGDLAIVLWSHVHGLATLAVHGALAAPTDTVTVDRLSALSSALVFGPPEPGR